MILYLSLQAYVLVFFRRIFTRVVLRSSFRSSFRYRYGFLCRPLVKRADTHRCRNRLRRPYPKQHVRTGIIRQ
ncbi:MAG: hypothetical protein ACI8PP_003132 [Candidatus Pseudothioglobus sp.]|jgi:hypothetical protein